MRLLEYLPSIIAFIAAISAMGDVLFAVPSGQVAHSLLWGTCADQIP